MFTDYQECKNKVLSEHERYVAFVREIEVGIKGSGLEKSQKNFAETFKKINKAIADIKADRFRIMIAGEAKSGKSTFINAYLGVELLPMDVKQCTSSIRCEDGYDFRQSLPQGDSTQRRGKGKGHLHHTGDYSCIRAA